MSLSALLLPRQDSPYKLYGGRAGFTGANANGLFEVGDEYLAVTDLAGSCRVGDGLDDLLGDVVVDGQFDLGLRQEVDDVLGAAVQLRVAALAPEALDLGDGDALYADVGDGLADVVELEGLDDRGDQFPVWNPLACKFKRAGREASRPAFRGQRSKDFPIVKISDSSSLPTRSSLARISEMPKSISEIVVP